MKSLFRLSLLLLLALLTLVTSGAFVQQAATVTDETRYEIPDSDEGLPGSGPIRRGDWFRKLWKARRSTWAARQDLDQDSLVFLGDSITQGWGDEMSGAFPGVKVANRGIGGDTTRGMLIRLTEDVIVLNPSGVVILAGTNDLSEQALPATIAGNLSLIIAQLKQHNSQMPIVLCRLFPSSGSKNRPAEKIREVNRLYAETVHGDPQITVVDTWSLFANQEGDAKIEEFPDLLHPNDKGYMKWAGALKPVLATLGYLETVDDAFTPEPGFESLFNGRDLTGWGYRPTSQADIESRNQWHASDPNAAEWPIITEASDFEGQVKSEDGRYVALHDRLVVTTPPEGRKIQQIWTRREFGSDFVLKLEFRATPNADSGIYIRGPQLQCRDYLLAGPYKELKGYKPQDWNEIVVKVTGGIAYCTCNGEVLEEKLEVPASGPIGLEGDRGQVEYRRIRIRKLR
jgi:lysophospholipase L1-like esterase